MTRELTVRELFEAFVYFRRQGASPDYALQELRKLKPVISAEERDELAQRVRHWESTEGVHYGADPDARISPLPQYEEDQQQTDIVKCSNCGAENRRDATYCYACGELLIAYGTRQLPVVDNQDEPVLGDRSRLIFVVRGYEDYPIEFNIKQRDEIILGRASQDNPIVPDIDLSDFDGKNLGVSRLHATIKYSNDTVTVSDMGSVNHTYLNGERLFPQEVRVLREGDELRLGRLVMRVSFQKTLKRIR